MLGIICGLESEAVLARQINGAQVACAGARPQKARWMARELVKKGATHLMSYGIAGGLEPGLPIGSMVIGTHVASTDGNWACDNDWINRLAQKLPTANCGAVWGSETLIPSAQEKLALYRKSRCLVVDMESQCVAQIAAEARVPFAVIRVVCDGVEMNMPPFVMAVVAEDGRVNIVKAIWNLLRHPGQIPDLLKVGRGNQRAHRVLRQAVAVLSLTD